MKNKVKEIYCSLYGEYVHVIASDDVKYVLKYIKKNVPKDFTDEWIATVELTYADGGACFVSTEANMHFMCLPWKYVETQDVWYTSTVLHECLHITNRILSRRGLHLTIETEEAYCYFQQWLFKEIYQSFKK